MRLFVTGGTGFLGSHFLRQAVVAGHECIALIRPGREVPEMPAVHWLAKPLGEVTAADLDGCDAVVHLASAGVSPQPVTWDTAMEVNVRQAIRLLVQAEEAGVPRLLLCGSCFEYGRSGDRYDFIPTDAPLEPVGPYAASKAAFSLAAAAFARTSAASLVLLRPFHFFGEGQHDSNFWPSLRRAALAGEDFSMTPGEQVRDFQPVEETAAGFLHALADWPGTAGRLHTGHLGSGQPVTLREFAAHWWSQWQATGKLLAGALPYRAGEVMRFVPDLSR